MTNADGNAGETSPSGPGSQPSEPLSSGYEAPSIEQSQDRPQTGQAQPSYEFGPPSYGINSPYPPAIDYPTNIPHDYPPPPGFPPPFPGDAGYPPPAPGYPPPPGYGMPGGYPVGYGMPGYPGGYGVPPANSTNNLAIGSLVTSILSLPMLLMCAIGLIAAFVGIGLGIAALNQIKQSEQSGFGPRSGQSGRGMAIAGIAVGTVSLLINGGWILMFVVALFSAS
ncbi:MULTISPECIES: DUF4190 domain-containing protein [unclassified Mycolicibacterium]|uniref:DUF4190 domain-containing protein n=1 Tax=unclassified Mycolicibacterium TaxID=2636767 RepID=UPI0012DF3F65|nr:MULTISPECIES: DUF4190 domain-containing protein [unclassified Mycolicibacterium]MUL84947.1 DUF4190 domain-containing protein [Mycolicibacterium sp. CBMA 329]MUL90914.1 DUF4190 domain-containing protein [Mycolicibacterium sp. CBMA 331]MUL98415.1 DUF4190 domain-containing protein [Mycolicibacterium sp. CBMA 334]MUM29829.1 DUF4190 domain-containing protein [Mycolicibacterium sp. CBMA 295]MUM40673.1 DUF4190 domain-containing protein [Mycolicibacterium sp. CBMA 247]